MVFTGTFAAFLKERVARYTLWSLHAQASRTWDYRWIRAARARMLTTSTA
jgi:hypothetical protein